MALLAVGPYPAVINSDLVGGALVHCAKAAECRVMRGDEDFDARVAGNEELEALGVRCVVVDEELREVVKGLPATPPDPMLTTNANEKTRLALRYTSGTT